MHSGCPCFTGASDRAVPEFLRGKKQLDFGPINRASAPRLVVPYTDSSVWGRRIPAQAIMETVTILWTACMAVAMTLAVVCGFVWLIERRNVANLMLCVLGVATAGSAYCELGMMHSETVAAFVGWLRWYSLPIILALVSQLLFVHYYLGTGRVWLLWTVILARAIVAGANLFVYPNFNFSSVVSLRRMPLFGEQVSAIAIAVSSQRQWFAVASVFLWSAYLIDAAIQEARKGDKESRRKAAAVVLAILVPMSATSMYTQLLVFGIAHAPVSNVPWFLAALVMMISELGRNFIMSRRERLELAELRTQLARSERVSLLGQLASALAHELSQPLAATSANVKAGLLHLKADKPDFEELRSILEDIGDDDHRASQIIHRMRQLFRQRSIEMQPIRVEDLVQDVVALVRAETASKHVELRVIMPSGLPRVFGDRVHLTQVILNLLMNSVHALQSCRFDTRQIWIEAHANDAKGEVEVSVRDSGPGIPPGVADELFKPFFTTKSDGTGIGLALSRTIIEAHGGHLWCDDSRHDGAMFRFTVRQVSSPEYSVDKDRRIASSAHESAAAREAPA